ncbi:aminodeoxychorismate lyase [Marinimicrobium sp. ABcell2]|uniref:aminodeoxychorismate lyase n=1 Tax=Marinimicrobium sp. ABcell2 TaxID=3069751 RepID=UPI0027B85358|nr:aminodeoxychorismate lyase [Marinimicrobium sp. ABcell2]MDQ2075678.1 aminodeoxychorismate lyase [Marinimicrobium sp. ABcell2]
MSELKQPLVSVNGVLGAMISPLDRGFAYGDGLFETIRVQSGGVPLWPFHEQRLSLGAGRLGIRFSRSDLHQYRDDMLAQAASGNAPDGVLKLILTRGAGGRGYLAPENGEPTLCLMLYPQAVPLGDNHGVTVKLCQYRLADNPALAGIKHLNRLEQVLARSEWRDGPWTEGLLLNQRGEVVEATASNLFAVLNGELLTPDLSNAGVAGVARRLIIDCLAPSIGLVVKEVPLPLDALSTAEEVFLCNSVKGITPVAVMDLGDRVSLPVGPVTRRLQEAFNHQLECGLV